MDLKTFRQDWSSDQKRLREMLKAGVELDQACDLFFSQHAVLHSQKMADLINWSYADEIFSGVEVDQYRIIPDNEDHSLIWILWHISRIEDVTMNVLVAGGPQIFVQDQWKARMASTVDHVGNLISPEDLLKLSRFINLNELIRYRDAVGRQTRSIVSGLSLKELRQKVQPERLTRLVDEGAVLPEAESLLAYWGKRKIFEMLLMPPTRHLMTHLNEAWSIKKKLDNLK